MLRHVLGFLPIVLLSAVFAVADDKMVEPETVVNGLSNPCGVAVQPETNHVFVADSAAGRIVRIVDGKVEEVVTGFPLDVYGKGPKYNIGPLGIAFFDKNTLVVGDGGFPDGEELIRVYTVPEVGADPIAYDAVQDSAGPIKATEEIQGEGNLYGLAVTDVAVFATANGDDTKGWVARTERGEKLGDLKRFIATKEAVEVDAPVGITISPRGEVVVGQMGEITVPNDSLLSFYGAKTGKLLLNLETGLFDITALVYSPKTALLYATDFAWMDTGNGGLFRIDHSDDDRGCKTVKKSSLDKPTAMAFAPDGTLYVTVIGTAENEEDEEKSGKLLKFAPGL